MIVTVTLNPAVDKVYVVDQLSLYRVERVERARSTPGGKGINVARVAAGVGERVLAMGIVGGHTGRWLLSMLKECGLAERFTPTEGETRCCVSILDGSGRATELLEPGPSVSLRESRMFLEAFEEVLPAADVVALSGSLPRGLPADYYQCLIAMARDRAKPVLLDTSGPPLARGIAARPTLIKPNALELCQHAGCSDSLEDLAVAARALHRQGIPVVAVSLGRGRVLVACREGVFRGLTPDVPVANTVGCGDSMVAGFAAAMRRGYGTAEAIRYATALSTANAMTAEIAAFAQADLDRLLREVAVERID